MSQFTRTATVALMGVSLLLYIGWTIASMLARHRYDFEFSSAMRSDGDLLREMNDWDAVERKKIKGMISLQRWWPAVFYTSFATGVGGASVLIFGSALAAFG